MKKSRMKLRKRIYPILWSGIIVISLFLLSRFANLSFSANIGQADSTLVDILFSGLCSKVMEEGSSLVSYTAEEEQFNFPIEFAMNEFALQRFTDSNSVVTVEAKEYSSLLDENHNAITKGAATETMSTGIVNGTDIYEIPDKYLSREYVLSNGAVYNSSMVQKDQAQQPANVSDQLQVGYEKGDVYEETEDRTTPQENESVETANTTGVKYSLDQLKDINFLIRNFYIVDGSTKITETLFNAEKLLDKDMKLKQDNKSPQILIYHTHSKEAYANSRAGNSEDTVVGVGSYLTDILKDKYGYNVIHDTTAYDYGADGRNVAYTRTKAALNTILKKNPTIEVVIDLHRDGGNARTVTINGKETARVMLFNGLSRDNEGPITYLDNPNLQNNLAFSLQMQLKSKELYPNFFVKNYLKPLRYNMHVRPKCLLVELGTEENTIESAKNAMVPFAKVLDSVLQGE